MAIRSYREMRTEAEVNRVIIHTIAAEYNGNIPEKVQACIKKIEDGFKKDCREFYKHREKYYPDPLSVPLRNNVKAWRTVADPDEGDCCTDFIIIPDKWQGLWDTEDEQTIYDEIEQFVYDTVGYDSPYPYPVGRVITLRWSFVRTPAGIAIVHRRGLDW